jgi:DNA-binding transcriptional LysR family regulator
MWATKNYKTFCDLIETKSFSDAGKLNSLTQSAVSQLIRKIENELNAPLLVRSKVQIRLTPEGEVFYSAAKEIVNRVDRVTSDLNLLKNNVVGNLSISSVYSVGLQEWMPCLNEFHKAYPFVNVNIKYESSDSIYSDIRKQATDIGIVTFPKYSRNLEVISIGGEPLIVICHPKHPLGTRRNIRIDDLTLYRLVTFGPDNPFRQLIDEFFRKARVSVERVIEFDNIESIKNAVAIDSGFALMPAAAVVQEIKQGVLLAREIEGGSIVRPLGIIYSKSRALSSPMKVFINALQLSAAVGVSK